MEHKKLTSLFRKELQQLKQETITASDNKVWYDLIKESIAADIKDGYKATIARNLTLGIGVHCCDYAKQQILNEDTQGWQYITRYLLWQKHILQKLFDYQEVASRSVGGIIGLSTLWEMTDLAALSRQYFQLLLEGERTKYAHKETHHLLMAILYDLYQTGAQNQELYALLPEENVYKKLLDNWYTTDEQLLAGLLSEVCDFHIYSSLDLKDKFSELLSLNYIPYDIRLIEKIRTRQGLFNVRVAHPLLETPLAEIPGSYAEWDLSNDEVYRFLVARE